MFTTFSTSLSWRICSIYLLVMQHFRDQQVRVKVLSSGTAYLVPRCFPLFATENLCDLQLSSPNMDSVISHFQTSLRVTLCWLSLFSTCFPEVQFHLSANSVEASHKQACFKSARMDLLTQLLLHCGPCQSSTLLGTAVGAGCWDPSVPHPPKAGPPGSRSGGAQLGSWTVLREAAQLC